MLSDMFMDVSLKLCVFFFKLDDDLCVLGCVFKVSCKLGFESLDSFVS